MNYPQQPDLACGSEAGQVFLKKEDLHTPSKGAGIARNVLVASQNHVSLFCHLPASLGTAAVQRTGAWRFSGMSKLVVLQS